MKLDLDQLDRIRGLEMAEVKEGRFRTALLDIVEHTEPPFTSDRWIRYVHDVAAEALGINPDKEYD